MGMKRVLAALSAIVLLAASATAFATSKEITKDEAIALAREFIATMYKVPQAQMNAYRITATYSDIFYEVEDYMPYHQGDHIWSVLFEKGIMTEYHVDLSVHGTPLDFCHVVGDERPVTRLWPQEGEITEEAAVQSARAALAARGVDAGTLDRLTWRAAFVLIYVPRDHEPYRVGDHVWKLDGTDGVNEYHVEIRGNGDVLMCERVK